MSEYIKVSVIVPYFQREPGILRRALESILRQRLDDGIKVDIIVVNDGSPVPVQPEIYGLSFTPPFHLYVITQPNGGVAAARNAGLQFVDALTKYVAFLDSDDSWHEWHLNKGIAALQMGNDFYFCDNHRIGVHSSNFNAAGVLISCEGDAIISISRENIINTIIHALPIQVSTVIYRRERVPGLQFDTALKSAGEDKLFFAQLASRVQKICFSPNVMVDCGTGLNIYFSNLNWDSDGNLWQVIDDLKTHYSIGKVSGITRGNIRCNKSYIARLRRKLTFLVLRKFVKNKFKWPAEMKVFARDDKWFYVWFPIYALQVAIGRAIGLYKPS